MIEKVIERLNEKTFTAELYDNDKWNGQTVNNLICLGDVKEVLEKIAAEYNNGWIPCSDRIPTVDEYLKNDGRFIVTDGNRIYQSIFDRYDSMTFCDMGYDFANHAPYTEEDKSVIAWQPLPAPYKPKEGES